MRNWRKKMNCYIKRSGLNVELGNDYKGRVYLTGEKIKIVLPNRGGKQELKDYVRKINGLLAKAITHDKFARLIYQEGGKNLPVRLQVVEELIYSDLNNEFGINENLRVTNNQAKEWIENMQGNNSLCIDAVVDATKAMNQLRYSKERLAQIDSRRQKLEVNQQTKDQGMDIGR